MNSGQESRLREYSQEDLRPQETQAASMATVPCRATENLLGDEVGHERTTAPSLSVNNLSVIQQRAPHNFDVRRAIELTRLAQQLVAKEHLCDHKSILPVNSELDHVTTLGIMFDHKTRMISNILVGGPASNSKNIFKGDVIVSIDGNDLPDGNIQDMLVGTDKPNSVITLGLKRSATGNVDQVELRRTATRRLADKRRMLELFTKLSNCAKHDADREAERHLQEVIELWTAEMNEQAEHDELVNHNVREMQENCGAWFNELLQILEDGLSDAKTPLNFSLHTMNTSPRSTPRGKESKEDELNEQIAHLQQQVQEYSAKLKLLGKQNDEMCWQLSNELSAAAKEQIQMNRFVDDLEAILEPKKNMSSPMLVPLDNESIRKQALERVREFKQGTTYTTINPTGAQRIESSLSHESRPTSFRNTNLDDLNTYLQNTATLIEWVRTLARDMAEVDHFKVFLGAGSDTDRADRPAHMRSGLGIAMDKGCRVVGGPAVNGRDLLKGDTILAVNDVPVDHVNVQEILNHHDEVGAVVDLDVARSGKRYKIQLIRYDLEHLAQRREMIEGLEDLKTNLTVGAGVEGNHLATSALVERLGPRVEHLISTYAKMMRGLESSHRRTRFNLGILQEQERRRLSEFQQSLHTLYSSIKAFGEVAVKSIQSLEASLKEERARTDAIAVLRKSLEAEREALLNKLSIGTSLQIETFHKLSDAQAEVEKLRARTDGLAKQCQSLEAERESLVNQLSFKSSLQIETLDKLSDAQAEVETLRARTDALAKHCQSLEADCQSLVHHLSMTQNNLSDAHAEIQTLTARTDALAEQCQSFEAERESLAHQLSMNSSLQIETLNTPRKAQAEGKTLVSLIAELQEAVRVLHQKLEASQAANLVLDQKNNRIEMQLDDLQKENNRLITDYDKLSCEHSLHLEEAAISWELERERERERELERELEREREAESRAALTWL